MSIRYKLPMWVRLIEPIWFFVALRMVRRKLKMRGRAAVEYAHSLWDIMVFCEDGFMTPRQCLEIDQQYWGD